MEEKPLSKILGYKMGKTSWIEFPMMEFEEWVINYSCMVIILDFDHSKALRKGKAPTN